MKRIPERSRSGKTSPRRVCALDKYGEKDYDFFEEPKDVSVP